MSDIDPRIKELITPRVPSWGISEEDMAAALVGEIRICRLPNEHRFRVESTAGMYSWGRGIETGPKSGTVKFGVTGPGEGVMVLFDGDDERKEINPHKRVKPLWEIA